MTDAGAFNPAARAAIYHATLDRCAGCGRAGDLSAQHRRARGMGGTSDVTIGHPANGVALCGGQLAGVRGCHGWAERNPTDAELLGWRLAPGVEALGSPFYAHPWGTWLAWDEDGPVEVYEASSATPVDVLPACPVVRFVDLVEDLDRPLERFAAVERMRLARPLPPPTVKSQR
jgi:hypothetical protein